MHTQGWPGLIVFLLIALVLAENRRRISLKQVAVGVAAQLIIGWGLLKLPIFRQVFVLLNEGALALEAATTAGTTFVFGYLGGGALPFAETADGAAFILAFRALPMVLVVSALSALLFHWGILPRLVRGFSWCLQKTMGVGGPKGWGCRPMFSSAWSKRRCSCGPTSSA